MRVERVLNFMKNLFIYIKNLFQLSRKSSSVQLNHLDNNENNSCEKFKKDTVANDYQSNYVPRGTANRRPKLTLELIPVPCWNLNLRQVLPNQSGMICAKRHTKRQNIDVKFVKVKVHLGLWNAMKYGIMMMLKRSKHLKGSPYSARIATLLNISDLQKSKEKKRKYIDT